MNDLQTVDCDVLVIGGGITGCFIALRLGQKGLTVCLADKGSLFREASGRSGGGVRQQFRTKAELPLAMESVCLWRGLTEELGEDMEYYQGGSLRLHRTRQLHEEDTARVEQERAQGLEVHLLTPQQVRGRLPILSENVDLWGGTFCPSDGTANPLLLAVSWPMRFCGLVSRYTATRKSKFSKPRAGAYAECAGHSIISVAPWP